MEKDVEGQSSLESINLGLLVTISFHMGTARNLVSGHFRNHPPNQGIMLCEKTQGDLKNMNQFSSR